MFALTILKQMWKLLKQVLLGKETFEKGASGME